MLQAICTFKHNAKGSSLSVIAGSGERASKKSTIGFMDQSLGVISHIYIAY